MAPGRDGLMKSPTGSHIVSTVDLQCFNSRQRVEVGGKEL